MRLDAVKGVGSATLKKLKSLGIESTKQLINFLPKTYIDFSMPILCKDAQEGQFSLFKIKITKVSGVVRTKNKLNFFTADAEDANDNCDNFTKDIIKLVWFNQPYLYKNICCDKVYLCFGKVKKEGKRIDLVNPQIEEFDKAKNLKGIMPVYRTKGLMYQGVLRGIIKNAFEGFVPDKIITDAVCEKHNLKPLIDAYYNAHFPVTVDEGIEGQKRIALEDTCKEILYYKIINKSAKNSRFFNYDKPFDIVKNFINTLPFSLTPSQNDALQNIFKTLHSNTKLSQILIGDVGSGKTVVALILMLYAVKCGYQSAIIAPTEILAEQHYRTFLSFLKDENVNVAFLSSATPAPEKKIILQKLRCGEIDILIGTHSIIQKNVEFCNLSFVVIDEQHKFGVSQKYEFEQKGQGVDTLTLTATPIPRSILMLIYDELQLSIIDKNHNTKVTTRLVPDSKKYDMFNYILAQAKLKNQAFIVCPKIYDDEGMELYSALSLYDDLKSTVFRDVNVAVIHGKMKAQEKSKIMADFALGNIDVLISTTVIEVGIDIKNATTICVLNSERFGLATLHQLRGRVGRGEKSAYCFLHTLDNENPRLNAMVNYDDGFKLAELDFNLRGGGDYLGTRQSGDNLNGHYIMPLSTDIIFMAKDIVVNDLLVSGVELLKEDFDYYVNKFKDITIN